jgi:ADP-heptose:LPS heptosyltransferase
VPEAGGTVTLPTKRPLKPQRPLSAVLVVRGGAIGDFILTLPVLAALRRHYPAARLAVLGRPNIAVLAQAGGLAGEVRSIEDRRLTGFFVRDGDLDPEFASFFARFDLVLSYLYDPDGVFRANLTRCSGARFIAGPHRPDESLPLHATEVFLKPLEALGIVGADPVPRLRLGLPCPDRTPVSGTGSPTIALHPGSGSERKNWPEQKWGELISRLLDDTSLDPLLVGGEAEGGRLHRLAAGRPSPRLHLLQDLPLVDLARRLSGCTAFIGHDSGISHLAAALGLPGVILWGDSVEAVWRPRSDRCLLLRDPRGLAELPVSRVLEALHSLRERAHPQPQASSRPPKENRRPIGSSV